MGTGLLILLSQFPPSPTLGAQESCRLNSSTPRVTVSPVCALVTSGESLGCDHKAHRAITLSSLVHTIAVHAGVCCWSQNALSPFFADWLIIQDLIWALPSPRSLLDLRTSVCYDPCVTLL